MKLIVAMVMAICSLPVFDASGGVRDVKVLIAPIEYLGSGVDSGVGVGGFGKLERGVGRYFDEVSGGRIGFEWVVGDLVGVGRRIEEYGDDRGAIIGDALAAVGAGRDLVGEGIDYVIVAPIGATVARSFSYVAEGAGISAMVLGEDYFGWGRDWRVVAHEFGHYFGMVDLYGASEGSWFSQFEAMGMYDLMNWPTGYGIELTAWNRWRIGVLDSAEVRCVGSGGVFRLWVISDRDVGGAARAVFVDLGAGSWLVIENRRARGFDWALPEWAVGVIVYRVDLGVDGYSMRLLNRKAKVGDASWPMWQVALKRGERLRYGGYEIVNLGKVGSRISVSVLPVRSNEGRARQESNLRQPA